MKITFQNVRGMNDKKALFLKNTLTIFDLICMSEFNKNYDFDKKEINDNEFQFHTDMETSRLGIMASNTLHLTTVSKGLVLNQKRDQEDQTAIQSFVYKIRVKSRDIYIENVYVVPQTSKENLQKLKNHLHNQSKTFKYYMIGGDFNLKWSEKKTKDLFKGLHLRQIVKEYTRVQKFTKRIRDDEGKIVDELDRVSKSIIDLVFVNDNMKPFVKGVVVEQYLKEFDHKAVTVELDFPTSNWYIGNYLILLFLKT